MGQCRANALGHHGSHWWGLCVSPAPKANPPPPWPKGVSGNLDGGAEGTRTPDLLNAIQTRSQLRYSPKYLALTLLERPAGGAEGTRTPDLYSAIVALSQLSYSPPRRHRISISQNVRLVKNCESLCPRAVCMHLQYLHSN